MTNINWMRAEFIRDLYHEGYTLDELCIMWWEYPEYKIKQVVRGLHRPERI